jgi:hypothetical protein
MEIIITIISLFILIGLALSPIFLVKRLDRLKVKYRFITYLATGTVITMLISLVFAWWTDASDKMLLSDYGYNIDGMNETEFYGEVAPENMERVKSLQKSITAIGWPLKAIMTYVVFLPYLLAVYFVSYIARKYKKRTTPNIISFKQ